MTLAFVELAQEIHHVFGDWLVDNVVPHEAKTYAESVQERVRLAQCQRLASRFGYR